MTIKELIKEIKIKEELLTYYVNNEEFEDNDGNLYVIDPDRILDELSILYKKRELLNEN